MAVKVTFLFFYFQRPSNFAPFRPKNGATGGAGGTWLCDNAIYDEWSLPYKADESSKKKKIILLASKIFGRMNGPSEKYKNVWLQGRSWKTNFSSTKMLLLLLSTADCAANKYLGEKKEKWNDAALFLSLVSIDSGNRKKRRETRVEVNAICWRNPRKTLDSSAQANCAAQLLAKHLKHLKNL